MRYVEKLGWGVIAKKRLELHPSHSGLGNKWKHKTPPSIDDQVIPSGPVVDEIPLEEEIAETTRRNVRTGWGSDQEFETKDSDKKGNKKQYGLVQTSGAAGQDVRESGVGNGKSNNGKNNSSVGNSGNKGSDGKAQTAASARSTSNNGNSNKSGKSNNKGNSSGKSNSNGNKDNSSNNNGNNGGNNGNKGGNGNKK